MHYTGILAHVRNIYVRDRAVILMYHRVNPPDGGVPDYSPNGMTVTPAEFSMQMQFIRKHYDVVPLARIVSAVGAGEPLPPNMCAVTFDDGWRSVYEHAFPVLRAMSIPATVFLTTGYVSASGWSWSERARYLMSQIFAERKRILSESDLQGLRDRIESCELGGILKLGPHQLPQYVLNKVREIEKYDSRHRRRLMQTLEATAGLIATSPASPFLDWQQVREMVESGIEFGNHTVTHPVLPDLADDMVTQEIRGAADELQRELGSAPRQLAYPYGKFDSRVESIVERLGLVSACTTRIGPVRAGDNVRALNRINISSEVAGHEVLFAGRLLCW